MTLPDADRAVSVAVVQKFKHVASLRSGKRCPAQVVLAVDHQTQAFIEAEVVDIGRRVLLAKGLDHAVTMIAQRHLSKE